MGTLGRRHDRQLPLHSLGKYLVIALHHAARVDHEAGLDRGVVIDLFDNHAGQGVVLDPQIGKALDQGVSGVDLQVLGAKVFGTVWT